SLFRSTHFRAPHPPSYPSAPARRRLPSHRPITASARCISQDDHAPTARTPDLCQVVFFYHRLWKSRTPDPGHRPEAGLTLLPVEIKTPSSPCSNTGDWYSNPATRGSGRAHRGGCDGLHVANNTSAGTERGLQAVKQSASEAGCEGRGPIAEPHVHWP